MNNNEYEKTREKILSIEGYSLEQKKQYLKRIDILEKKGSSIILNSYHFSNLVGVKWENLKKIITNPDKFYHCFDISKKSGGKRKISVPNSELELCQEFIKNNILDKINISLSAEGFAPKKSIITNARNHLNKEMVLNVDLKDFFPSISSKKVFYVFNSICGYDNDLSYCLTKLVMYNGGLPQGACTSPILSNIVSFKLDIRLNRLAESLKISYSRYADDITFSGDSNKVNSKLLVLITKIINDCGYDINSTKTRFQSKYGKQEVTGLLVNNGRISVPRNYVKKIRQELYYIKRYGIDEHKKRTGIYNKFYREHLKGKIMFVYSINRDLGNKLLIEYNLIFDNNMSNKINSNIKKNEEQVDCVCV